MTAELPIQERERHGPRWLSSEEEVAVKLAGEIRSSSAAVTLVVHEHKRIGRGVELAVLAAELKVSDVGRSSSPKN